MPFCRQQPKLVSDAVWKVLLWCTWVQSHWHPRRLHPWAWVQLSLLVALVVPLEDTNPTGQRGQTCEEQRGSSWQCAGASAAPVCSPWSIGRLFQRVLFHAQKAQFIQIESWSLSVQEGFALNFLPKCSVCFERGVERKCKLKCHFKAVIAFFCWETS